MVGIMGVRIHPDAALDEFIGRRLSGLERAVPVGTFRGQVPLEGPFGQTCSSRIISVGSAAGQIYTLSGQGLRYALHCGEIAGEVAIDAVTEGDVSREALAEYERRWLADVGTELEIGRLLHSSLSVSQDQRMDSLLGALEEKPGLKQAFVNVFAGFKLEGSLKTLLKDDQIARIFGRGTVEKVLALK